MNVAFSALRNKLLSTNKPRLKPVHTGTLKFEIAPDDPVFIFCTLNLYCSDFTLPRVRLYDGDFFMDRFGAAAGAKKGWRSRGVNKFSRPCLLPRAFGEERPRLHLRPRLISPAPAWKLPVIYRHLTVKQRVKWRVGRKTARRANECRFLRFQT